MKNKLKYFLSFFLVIIVIFLFFINFNVGTRIFSLLSSVQVDYSANTWTELKNYVENYNNKTIKINTNMTANSKITITQGKNIKIYSSSNVTITRSDSFKDYFFDNKGNLQIDSDGIITFSGNSVDSSNSIIRTSENGSLTINKSNFYYNKAKMSGGAIQIADTINNINISNSSFMYNEGTYGGAIYIAKESATSNISLNNVTITNNESTKGGGGGIYAFGILTITGGKINSNTAVQWGGGFHLKTKATLKNGVEIKNNYSEYSGGGIKIDGYLYIDSAFIENNNSNATGGGIEFTSGRFYYKDKPLRPSESYIDTNTITLKNNTASNSTYNNSNPVLNNYYSWEQDERLKIKEISVNKQYSLDISSIDSVCLNTNMGCIGQGMVAVNNLFDNDNSLYIVFAMTVFERIKNDNGEVIRTENLRTDLVIYNNGNVNVIQDTTYFGHANGMAYDKETRKFYITNNDKHIVSFNLSKNGNTYSLSNIENKSSDVYYYGLAFDNDTNSLYGVKSDIYKLINSTNYKKESNTPVIDVLFNLITQQDITYYSNHILYAMYDNGLPSEYQTYYNSKERKSSLICNYNLSTGELENTFYIPYTATDDYEFEDVYVLDGATYLLYSKDATSMNIYVVTDDLLNPNIEITGTTNSVSNNQKLTITAEDDVGLESYYYGNNYPTSTTSFIPIQNNPVKYSKQITITSPGLYYFAVKDTSGKISDIKSIYIRSYTINKYIEKYNSSDYDETTYSLKKSYSYISLENSNISITPGSYDNYDYIGYTKKLNNIAWYKGNINSNGTIESSNTSYYSQYIRLNHDITYNISGFDSYNKNNILWKLYDFDNNYLGSQQGNITGDTYTPSIDCYVRILLNNSSTESQRNDIVITANYIGNNQNMVYINYDTEVTNNETYNLTWTKGFINHETGEIGTSTEYPDAYYTQLISLKAYNTYMISGYGNYGNDGIRWRVFDLSGNYLESIEKEIYTPIVDCKVRILYYKTSTSSQRSSSIINNLSIKPEETYNLLFNKKRINVSISSGLNGSTTYSTVSEKNNTVTVNPGSSSSIIVKYGDSIKATANPSSGYSFKSWSGDYISGSNNPETGSSITESKTISSLFVDEEKPSVSITGGTDLKKATQNVTIKCTDNVSVSSYYFGKTNITSANDITETTDLSSIKNNGINKSGLTEGTYYFACKDSAGNYDKKSIVIRKYQVQNVLEKIEGTRGSYNNSSYETYGNVETYFVKNGTQLVLNNIYNIPVESSSNSFLGFSTTKPSTTTISLDTTNPTVATNNTTIYYLWFNRKLINVSLSSGLNGSSTYSTVSEKNNSVTVNPGSSSNITVKYGDLIKATANPSSGYSFKNWGGDYISGSNNPETGSSITESKTILSLFVDEEKPSVSITGGTDLKKTTQNVTIKCTDNISVSAYYFGKTNITSSNDITETTDLSSIKNNGINKSGLTEGTYYFACKDSAGNYDKKSIVIRKYQVQNVLEKIEGTRGSYNNSSYETYGNVETYFVKNGTQLVLNNIYNIPVESSSNSFLGFSTTKPSTTTISLDTTNPTVATNNTTIYYLWFNRNNYTLSIKKSSNGSITAETVTQKNNSTTVEAGASANGSLIIKYGDKVKITSIPKTGYDFISWSGYVSGSTNPVIGNEIKSNKSITASYEANDLPIINNNYVRYEMDTRANSILDRYPNATITRNGTLITGDVILYTGDVLNLYGKSYEIAIIGDVNNNGVVTISDVTKTYGYFKNKTNLTEVQKIAADYNSNGYINISDVTAIYNLSKSN